LITFCLASLPCPSRTQTLPQARALPQAPPSQAQAPPSQTQTPPPAQAPKLYFTHLSYEQGLSNSSILNILQDYRGYMWFGTRDGLNRYDGREMTVFRNVQGDSGSISGNYITSLCEDQEHNLWIGTLNGLNCFDRRTNKFTRYVRTEGNAKSLLNNAVNCVYEDNGHHLWVCSSGGLSLFNRETNDFTSFRPGARYPDYQENDKINYMYQDSRGALWLASNQGLLSFDPVNRTFNKYPAAAGSPIINCMREMDGQLWLGTQNSGIILFDITKKVVTATYQHDDKNESSLSNNMVISMFADRENRLWIGTVNGGLNLYNEAKHCFYYYKDEPENKESLSKRNVSSIFEDNEGNLWVGTSRGGLNIFAPHGNKFKLYQARFTGSSLSYNDVQAFCEDWTGNVWIGTDGGGLNYFDRKKNTFTYYRHDPFNKRSLGADEITHIMQDSRNNIWVSTWGGGLNLLDRAKGDFTRFMHDPHDSSSIGSNHVQKTFEDSHGNIWVATYYGGLNLLDPKTRKFRRIISDPTNESSFYGNDVVSIAEDKSGHLWFGTNDGGLNCYDTDTRHFYHYFNNLQSKVDLRILFVDSKGRVWVGQEGLYLFDPVQNSFSIATTEAGLSAEFIKGITEDARHNLWISSSHGLTEFNPDSGSFKAFNTRDGLQGMEFEENAYLKTKDGEMFFGGINGFNTFYPDQIVVNRFIPPVYITELQIFNKKIVPGTASSILKSDISLTDQITLSYKQSSIAFKFAALNYSNPGNNEYAYKLERFDKDWHYTNNENKANYTNLDPGEYYFRVKASNNDGIWNEKGSSLRIVITPPFWKTGWFLTLLSVFITGGLYTFYRFKRRSQSRKMEERKREDILRMQLQFFTNISHEFRTPLSLIIGPSERLLKEDKTTAFRNYHQSIYKNANRLMSLINELMDFRKLEVGALKLHVSPGNFNLFLEEISEEFYDWADDKNIRFTVKLNQAIPDVWFDRQVLEKIVLNLLSNSFKYTASGGTITLELLDSILHLQPSFAGEMVLLNEYKAKDYVYIRIIDNGIGISKESIKNLFERYYRIADYHLGSGIGLAFVKSLTFLHKGNILVYSERHKGTEIIIAIPRGEHNYEHQEKWTSQKPEGRIKLESIHNGYDKELTRSEEGSAAGPDGEMAGSASIDAQIAGVGGPAKKPGDIRHILLTEDNDELRSFLKDCLQPFYHVSEAVDGNMGLIKAKQESPDLIISDVMMPGMNGTDFCKLIKQDIETSHIPFMMLTAKDAHLSKVEGASAGADFYFSKPLSIELLLLTLRNIFDHKQKLREHYTKNYNIDARELTHSSKDRAFMETLLEIIDSQLINPELDIDIVCRSINMSRTRLYEKIKAITGQSVGDFIRTIRLKKAVDIMLHEDVSLMEIACRVGIQTQSYFTKAFKKQYGKTPTQFMQELAK
jgi:signal transduction histidine kinase/ligand-binding sensor domain-containing protein/AraC-like DNA-binding protein